MTAAQIHRKCTRPFGGETSLFILQSEGRERIHICTPTRSFDEIRLGTVRLGAPRRAVV